MSAKIEVPLSVSTVFPLKHPSFKPESNTNIVLVLVASDTVWCTTIM